MNGRAREGSEKGELNGREREGREKKGELNGKVKEVGHTEEVLVDSTESAVVTLLNSLYQWDRLCEKLKSQCHLFLGFIYCL